jgi:hypothetical protein
MVNRKKRDDSKRPKYRVSLGLTVGGYYHPDVHFKGVPKEEAEQLFHKEANNVRNYLHRTIGIKGAALELVS